MDWLWAEILIQNKVIAMTEICCTLQQTILSIPSFFVKNIWRNVILLLFWMLQLHVYETKHRAWPSVLERANLDTLELFDCFLTSSLLSRYKMNKDKYTLDPLFYLRCSLNQFISVSIFEEPGPYRERAKTIYNDLRSNLMRYWCSPNWNCSLISLYVRVAAHMWYTIILFHF